ncbi:MAG: extracellular solute-binding protein, partial [Rivularia sp. (in: cyanobacteria)]
KGEFTVFIWLPFMWSGGGELALEPAKIDLANNKGAISGLQLWQDLVKDGSAILSAPERGFETDAFVSGKVAMQVTGPWTLTYINNDIKDGDYGVFPIPKSERQATSIGGENLFLFKTRSEREKAAFEFAEYVASEDFQTEWALGTGYLPANLKSRRSEKYQSYIDKNPTAAIFLEQAQYGRSRPVFAGYTRVSESIGRAMEAVLLGKSSPKQALKESQQRLDLIFK